jgi:phage-related protein
MATLNFKFLADVAGLKTGVDQAQAKLGGFESATKNASAKIKGALGAISFIAIVKGLTDAAKAAQEDQIAQDLLAQQLRTTTGATDAQIKSAEGFISAMSKQAGIADDTLRPALQNAVRGTGDLSKGQELLQIAIDGAAASGKPLDAVLNALIKANNGNTGALYKLAPQLKETKGGIDDFAASVKGAGETAASPFDKFKVALDEAKETIGAAFLPVLNSLITTLGPLIEKIAPTLAKLIEGLAPIFIKLVEALIPLVEAILPPLIELFDALMPAIEPLIDLLVVLLVPIIKILAKVMEGLIKFLVPIIKAFADLAKGIMNGFGGIGTWFKTTVNGWISVFEGFVNGVIDGINIIPKAMNKLKFKIPDWVPFMGGQEFGFKLPTFSRVKIPRLAKGGIVMPSPGGSIVNVAEAGKAEAIIPLDRLGSMGGGNTYVININKASITGDEVIRAIRRYEVSQGRAILNG